MVSAVRIHTSGHGLLTCQQPPAWQPVSFCYLVLNSCTRGHNLPHTAHPNAICRPVSHRPAKA